MKIVVHHAGYELATLYLEFVPRIGETLRITRVPNMRLREEDQDFNGPLHYFLKVNSVEHFIDPDNTTHHHKTLVDVSFEDNDGFIPEEWGYSDIPSFINRYEG